MQMAMSGADFTFAPGVCVETGALRDPSGKEYPINAAAELVAAMSTEAVDVSCLTQAVALQIGVPLEKVSPVVEGFLVELQQRGLGSIGRSFGREWIDIVRDIPFRVLTTFLSRRLPLRAFKSQRSYPIDVVGIVQACLEGHQSIAWIGVVGAVIAGVIESSAVSGTLGEMFYRASTIGLLIAALVLMFLTTTVVHECAHALTALCLRTRLLGIRARLGAPSVIFSSESYLRRAGVAVVGPIVGAAFPVGVMFALIGFTRGSLALAIADNLKFALLTGCVALTFLQLAALLPPAHDGKVLWNVRRVSRRVDLDNTEANA